jgi:hypothetical protein
MVRANAVARLFAAIVVAQQPPTHSEADCDIAQKSSSKTTTSFHSHTAHTTMVLSRRALLLMLTLCVCHALGSTVVAEVEKTTSVLVCTHCSLFPCSIQSTSTRVLPSSFLPIHSLHQMPESYIRCTVLKKKQRCANGAL